MPMLPSYFETVASLPVDKRATLTTKYFAADAAVLVLDEAIREAGGTPPTLPVSPRTVGFRLKTKGQRGRARADYGLYHLRVYDLLVNGPVTGVPDGPLGDPKHRGRCETSLNRLVALGMADVTVGADGVVAYTVRPTTATIPYARLSVAAAVYVRLRRLGPCLPIAVVRDWLRQRKHWPSAVSALHITLEKIDGPLVQRGYGVLADVAYAPNLLPVEVLPDEPGYVAGAQVPTSTT